MTVEEKLAKLRERLKEERIDRYIITGTDPHQSEYTAPRWRTREFISGFTGSSGTVVITENEAYLWTDSRYFIQAAMELPSCYTLMKLGTEGTPDPWEWLTANTSEGMIVGVDSSEISIGLFTRLSEQLAKKKAKLLGTDDFLSAIWPNRPDIPMTVCEIMDTEYSGETSEKKLKRIRDILRNKGLRWTFIASLDDIAWITNLRADDIQCNPVFVSYLFISLSNGGMPSLILSLSLSRIPSLSQIGISGVRSLEREEFVLSSRSIGMPWHMLFFRHMARYVAPSMANQGILVFFSTILAESSLSFLGFSAYGSSPSLGLMIRKGMEYALSYPHLMAFPSLVLFFFLLSVFLVWDGGRVVDSSAH